MKDRKNQKGQSLIEFALILPLFIVLVIGFFDFGRAIFYYSSLTNAVREATRFAIVNRDAILAEEAENLSECDGTISDNPLKLKVMEYAFGVNEDMFDPCTDIIVVITRAGSSNQMLEAVSIEVTLNFQPITPILSQIVGQIPLVAQSKMYVTPGSS